MKILLLGATGRTGKLVLKQALDYGHSVNCLARKVERIPDNPALTLFEGNPGRKADLEKAIAGCDAVISVLNISRKSDFPWSRLRTPENYLSEVMSLLIPVAEEEKISRIIVCSAWGVAETRSHIPSWFRWFIENSNIGVAYKDHERQEKIITNSNLNWTIVRPVGLINSNRKQRVLESFDNSPKPSLTISRRSVANYIVESLNQKDLIGQKVVISGK